MHFDLATVNSLKVLLNSPIFFQRRDRKEIAAEIAEVREALTLPNFLGCGASPPLRSLRVISFLSLR